MGQAGTAGTPRDRGAVAVEMAIVLPVLVLLTFGIIDFSRIFNAEIELSQGAREGARIASLGTTGGFTASDARAQALAWAPNPGFTGGAATVSTASDVQMCPNGSNQGSVTVHYQFSGILFYTGGIDLKQKAVMRCGG